jgi:hypothetical protein
MLVHTSNIIISYLNVLFNTPMFRVSYVYCFFHTFENNFTPTLFVSYFQFHLFHTSVICFIPQIYFSYQMKFVFHTM